MAAMDTRIPLLAQAPNILWSYVRGVSAANSVNAMRRDQAKQDFLKQYGTDLYNGDANAMAAYAQFDPQGAMSFRAAADARARAAAARRGPAHTSPSNANALDALLGVTSVDPVNPNVSAPITQPQVNGGDMPALPDAGYSAPITPTPANEQSQAWERGGVQAGPSNLQDIVAGQAQENAAVAPAAPTTPQAAPVQYDQTQRQVMQLSAIASDPSYSPQDRARAKAGIDAIQQQQQQQQDAEKVQARAVIQALDVAHAQGQDSFNQALQAPGFSAAAQQYGVNYDNWNVQSAAIRETLGMKQAPQRAASGNAKEKEIASIMETGLSRDQAIAIAYGINTVSRDPQRGDVVLVNKGTGQIINPDQTSAPPPTTAPQQPVAAQQTDQLPNTPSGNTPASGNATMDPNVDYSLAFGARGFGIDAANRALDTFGLGQAMPGVDTAIKNLENLGATTKTVVLDGLSVKPTNKILDFVEKLVVNPAEITNGPAGALNRTNATLRMLEELASQKSAIANGNFSVADRSKAQIQLMKLNTLTENYRILQRSLQSALDRAAPAAPAADGGQANLPQSFLSDPSVAAAIAQGASASDIWDAYGGDKSKWQ